MGPVTAFIASLFAGEAFSEGVGAAKKGINRQITEKEFTQILDQFDLSFTKEHEAEIVQYGFDIQIVKEKRAILVSHAENYLKQDNSDFRTNLKQEFIEVGCEVIGAESILVENYLACFYDLIFWKVTKKIPIEYKALLNAYANEQHDINHRLDQRIKDLEEEKKEPDTVDFSDFYNSVVEEFTEEKDNSSVELFGSESDDKAYIEQFISVGSEQKSALTFLSDWFDKKENGTLLICGEPGHGKSLLCKKAVVEFKRGNFLKDKAQNVLLISLNTGENPGIISGKEVNFDNMLSWGPIREHKFKFENCRGSLLFMDGFDEFIDEAKKTNLKDIVSFMNKVGKIAQSYKIHIVVLSRLIAVQKDLHDQDICNKSFELTPITKEQQTEWVKARNNYSDYNDTLMKLQDDKDMCVLLGIPLLFRMIVHTQYNKVSSNIVELYDGLFEHLMRKRGIHGDDLDKVRKDLSDHAYKVYCNDEDTAEVEVEERDENWVFAFYVKSGQGSNVGFFHLSFYQYFLARYILSHITDVETDEQAEGFIGLFAERELNDTVRLYLSLLINKENIKAIHNKLKLVIEALVRTDAFLNLKPRYQDGKVETTILGRTINVYRNTLHISAAFSYVIEKPFSAGMDVLLRTYPSNSITICSLVNNKDNLFRANLSGVDLRVADLRGASLIGADLSRSDLGEANLKRSNLSQVNLYEANLSGAILSETNLSGANLIRAHLIEATLRGANLREAKLSRAKLFRANLREADLRETNLREAKLNRVDLSEAKLCRADLSKATLREANLSEAELSEVNLSGANLRSVNLREANLSEVDLSGANLIGAKLIGAKLNGAKLGEANLRGARLIGAKLIGVKLGEANLRGANLLEADLRGADLRGANLREANLFRANLREADLRGANLLEANLRVKCINNAFIDSDKKELIDPSIQGYETIRWIE